MLLFVQADILLELTWVDGQGKIHVSDRNSTAGKALVAGLGLGGVVTEMLLQVQPPSNTQLATRFKQSDAQLLEAVQEMLKVGWWGGCSSSSSSLLLKVGWAAAAALMAAAAAAAAAVTAAPAEAAPAVAVQEMLKVGGAAAAAVTAAAAVAAAPAPAEAVQEMLRRCSRWVGQQQQQPQGALLHSSCSRLHN
jgi:hypothetical protein